MPDADPGLRRWLIRGLVLIALIAVGVLLKFTWLAPDPLPVRVASVARGRVEATITNSKAGTLRSRRRSRISAETGGRVAEVLRHEGDRVKAGEVLVRLNDESLLAQVDLARASHEAAKARLHESCLNRDHAARELKRSRELRVNNVVSEEMLDRLDVAFRGSQAACSANQALQDQARASLRAAEAELAKAEIRAPFDGVIAEVNVEVGEFVTPSPPLLTSPPVADLLDPKSIYVSAPMDEVDSSRIAVGLPTKITVDSHPGRDFVGTVVRVAPYVLDVEAQNRTVEVEVDFGNEEQLGELLAGTSADVEIVLESHDAVLRIPTAALLEGGRVLLIEDGLLVERSIEVGLRNWDYAEIVRGLEEGEQVVVSLDRKEIEAGARARVESEPAVGTGS